ncbi:hypothetical protein Ep4_027 [Pseudomonas phage Ep4]|uniref:Uncharacterized protein n=1 Tax=Pseudomonas phage Ep4 TaxID=3057492 RepID=A0AAU9EHZ3_9CAUD|nr:hypothetical protein Ep4_027 [Pseudomonas phage Ep4]
MDKGIQVIMHCALSDSLSAAIDTGNIAEIVDVMTDAKNCLHAAQINLEQYADLQADVQVAGYEL